VEVSWFQFNVFAPTDALLAPESNDRWSFVAKKKDRFNLSRTSLADTVTTISSRKV